MLKKTRLVCKIYFILNIWLTGVAQNPRCETEDGFEMIIGTNHFGHFLLTNLLLDLLKKSAPSRIVTVASEGYTWGKIRFDDIHYKKNFNGLLAYGQSKLANILFSLELSKRLQGKWVKNKWNNSLKSLKKPRWKYLLWSVRNIHCNHRYLNTGIKYYNKIE